MCGRDVWMLLNMISSGDLAVNRLIPGGVVQYSQIDSIGVSGDKKGLHWYQWYDWYQ